MKNITFIIGILVVLCVGCNSPNSNPETQDEKEGGCDIPHFTGSFIQEFLVADWDDARWDQEMMMLKEVGMKYLIYAPSLQVNGEGRVTTNYPSSLTERGNQSNTLESCLRSAQKNKIKIFIGLNFNDRWWKVDYDADWLVGQMEIGNKVADELVTLYKDKYPDAMYGWYWVWEVDNLNCMTPECHQTLAKALNTNLDHLSKITPEMPFLMSPFMNYKVGGNAVEYGKMWENVFAQTHFRSGDIFSPQDCVGAGGLELNNLAEWFSKLKQAVDTKPELTFWGNVETFQRFWNSAPLERVLKQIEIVNEYVDNIICFAYSHYNSPFVVNPDYHRAYRQYYLTGQLPDMETPEKVRNVDVRNVPGGIEVRWIPSSNTKATDGFSIYRDGTLITKLQIRGGNVATTFVDTEGKANSVYEVAVYNVIGTESAKVRAK